MDTTRPEAAPAPSPAGSPAAASTASPAVPAAASSASSSTRAASFPRRRRRLTVRIRDGLRELSVQLSLLTHQVGVRLDLRDSDLECLDVISRDGPIGPTALARRTDLHPATLTGVLDRLERGGWVVRTPNPRDRRSVLVRIIEDKEAEVSFLYTGLNKALDDVCDDYEEAELVVIADFLLRTARAARAAADDIAGR